MKVLAIDIGGTNVKILANAGAADASPASIGLFIATDAFVDLKSSIVDGGRATGYRG